MIINVTGGVPAKYEAKGCVTQKPVYGSMESVYYVIKQLCDRQHSRLAVVELKHEINEEKDSSLGRHPHSCIYLFVDGTRHEILPVEGAAKGYAGEGARTAITLDTYIDLFSIPIKRRWFSYGMIQRMGGVEKAFEVPRPAIPLLTCENVERAKRRARDAKLYLSNNGFDLLRRDMPLEKVLDAVNFHKYK